MVASPRMTSVSLAAFLATLGAAGASQADTAASTGSATATPVHHATTLSPIVPLQSLLGMSAAAGVIAVTLGRKKRA